MWNLNTTISTVMKSLKKIPETISFMVYENGDARYYSTINKDYAENLYYSNHKLESQK